MNRFTIIVMTDSREDSDAVVSAVSALSRDKEAEAEAAIAQAVGQQQYVAEATAAHERAEMRKRFHMLKIHAALEPGETKAVKAPSRFPFHAAQLRVAGESAHHFAVDEIRYARPEDLDQCTRRVDFKASAGSVPAAAFSDDAPTTLDLDTPCSAIEIVVHNVSKKRRTFRAYVFGFVGPS